MSDTDTIAAAVKDPINRLGGAFMISREAKAFAAETGFGGWAPYFRGRCGVLGEVDADVVVAAAGFFPADVVREAWESAGALPTARAADRYARVCHDFGRRKLAGFAEADADRLAELLEKAVGNADIVGAPLAGGWRAMPLPPDGPARVIQLSHVLRELRAGLHLAAVLAVGLTPLEAVLTGASLLIPSGEANAEYFGWLRPYPEPTAEQAERRARAEELTDAMASPAFDIFGAAEADELVTLLGKAETTVFG